MLVAGLVGFALSVMMSPTVLDAWGWRVAFLLGALIVPFGLAVRRSLPETFHVHHRETAPPTRVATHARVVVLGILMLGAFIPVQVMMFPLVRILATLGLFSSLPGIVLIHIIFSMPVMTLLFRNYYQSIPQELFKAARIDGGGFWRIFLQLMLPMSTPIVIVAAIMQVTGVWNDYILGLVFAGRDNLPMTVQLNNVINTTTGTRLYNVNMAATILTSLVPLTIYFVSGRWFVRGIAAGAVKG